MFDSNGVERCDDFCRHSEIVDAVEHGDEQAIKELEKAIDQFVK